MWLFAGHERGPPSRETVMCVMFPSHKGGPPKGAVSHMWKGKWPRPSATGAVRLAQTDPPRVAFGGLHADQ